LNLQDVNGGEFLLALSRLGSGIDQIDFLDRSAFFGLGIILHNKRNIPNHDIAIIRA
jgi:hypothetical protein